MPFTAGVSIGVLDESSCLGNNLHAVRAHISSKRDLLCFFMLEVRPLDVDYVEFVIPTGYSVT